MAEVVLESVSRVYPGGTVALDSVSLEAREGELLVLLGPSGCGKTTTLRLIAGLEEASSGQIRIAGRDVRNVLPRDRDVALVFQDHALYPHLTVRGNLAFGLRMRSGGGRFASWLRRLVRPRLEATLAARRRGIDEQVFAAAQCLGIEHLLERRPGQLSGGERQRVALGRAIVRQPAVFLFDEPLSNLDAKLRVEMRREIRGLHERLAATMIYVTHDQVEALTLGDRVAVLDRGKLQQIGSPREVYERPVNRFVAGFVGTLPMNFVSGKLARGEVDRVVFRGVGFELELIGAQPLCGGKMLAGRSEREVTLGIRPADISLAGDGIAGSVKRVEFVGDATLVHVQLGPGRELREQTEVVIGKVEAATKIEVNQHVTVQFNLDRAHWFDAATGRNLKTEH